MRKKKKIWNYNHDVLIYICLFNYDNIYIWILFIIFQPFHDCPKQKKINQFYINS